MTSQVVAKVDELIQLGESYGLGAIAEARSDTHGQVRYNSRLYSVITLTAANRVSVRSFYQRPGATDSLSSKKLLECLEFYKVEAKVSA
jgi:hypothetical protein